MLLLLVVIVLCYIPHWLGFGYQEQWGSFQQYQLKLQLNTEHLHYRNIWVRRKCDVFELVWNSSPKKNVNINPGFSRVFLSKVPFFYSGSKNTHCKKLMSLKWGIGTLRTARVIHYRYWTVRFQHEGCSSTNKKNNKVKNAISHFFLIIMGFLRLKIELPDDLTQISQ